MNIHEAGNILHHTTHQLMTSSEVALRLHISKSTLYRMVKGREVPFYRIGRQLRFNARDVDALTESKRVMSNSEYGTS